MVKGTSLDHVCYLFEDGGHPVIIDPFQNGNPVAPVAAAGFLRSRQVMPMHYNTWELIAQDPAALCRSFLPVPPVRC